MTVIALDIGLKNGKKTGVPTPKDYCDKSINGTYDGRCKNFYSIFHIKKIF